MDKRQNGSALAAVENRRLVGVKDAASYINLSEWTLRSWAYSGKITSYKISTRLMFDLADLDRVIGASIRPQIAVHGAALQVGK